MTIFGSYGVIIREKDGLQPNLKWEWRGGGDILEIFSRWDFQDWWLDRWDMRRREALRSPEAPGGLISLSEVWTQTKEQIAGECISQGRPGEAAVTTTKCQSLKTAEVYFSLVLRVYHKVAKGSPVCPHPACRTRAQKPVFMLPHLLRKETEYGLSRTGPLKILPRSDAPHVPLTFHCWWQIPRPHLTFRSVEMCSLAMGWEYDSSDCCANWWICWAWGIYFREIPFRKKLQIMAYILREFRAREIVLEDFKVVGHKTGHRSE